MYHRFREAKNYIGIVNDSTYMKLFEDLMQSPIPPPPIALRTYQICVNLRIKSWTVADSWWD